MRRIVFLVALGFCGLFVKAQDSCINHWETVIYSDDNWRYVIDSVFKDHDWKSVLYCTDI